MKRRDDIGLSSTVAPSIMVNCLCLGTCHSKCRLLLANAAFQCQLQEQPELFDHYTWAKTKNKICYHQAIDGSANNQRKYQLIHQSIRQARIQLRRSQLINRAIMFQVTLTFSKYVKQSIYRQVSSSINQPDRLTINPILISSGLP